MEELESRLRAREETHERLEGELAELAELLGSRRVVTLTGPGGAGKTRLALQVAADAVDAYPEGVWFVSLAALRDPEVIAPTVGEVVGAADDVHAFVGGKRMLLLLDNLEHLLPAAAAIVASFETSVLATSRERLNVSGEQEYPVPPLPTDEASALFTQRARQLTPRFEPDSHVAEIVRRLDGLPLAVELAAARVKVLTPRQIAERLEHRLGLLTGGARDAPERQRTLRATVDWSYELLNPAEQRVFTQLAVFAGSFDLEAAESVCAADLDSLASLVEKSLLRRTEEGRFFLLETIREYALDRLGDADELLRRHAEYFFEVGLGAAEPGRGIARVDSFDLLARELPNLRAGVEWFLAAGPADRARRLGTILSFFWVQRSHRLDAMSWFEAAPLDDESATPALRAGALEAAALIALFVLEDIDRAEHLADSAQRLATEVGDEYMVAASLDTLGICARIRRDFNSALQFHRRAREHYRGIGDPPGEANSLHLLGELYRDLSQYEEAERYLDEAAAILRGRDQLGVLRHTVHSLGDLALDAAQHQKALRHYSEALRANVDVDGKREQLYCIAGIACVLAEAGREDEGARLWGAVEALEPELGLRIVSFEREHYERRLAPLVRGFEGFYREGSGMSLEEASAAALDASG